MEPAVPELASSRLCVPQHEHKDRLRCDVLSPNGAIWVTRLWLVKVQDVPREGGACCGTPPGTAWGKDRAPGHGSMAKETYTSKEAKQSMGETPQKEETHQLAGGSLASSGLCSAQSPSKACVVFK